jgi:hypothetical protein
MKREYSSTSRLQGNDGWRWPDSAATWDDTGPGMRGLETAIDPLVDSDEEALRRRIRLFFAASHFPSLRYVDISVDRDTVMLRGVVKSFYEKQMAAQFAARVAGVIRVVDRIHVQSNIARPSSNSFRQAR